ncbi:MAG: hypothetical protein ACI4RT_04365 [Candidatus Spyradenecus sp.]
MVEAPYPCEIALVDGRRLLRCGLQSYVDYPFPALLQSLNEEIAPASPLFPFLTILPGTPEKLRYALARAGVAEHSSLRNRALPRACLRQLQEAINRLHAWAEDPQVPGGTQDFCRNFALPDPVLDPEAYQLSRGPGGWRVHVLWGYESDEAPAIKPLSALSAHWADSADRVALAERFRKARPRFVLPWRACVRRLFVCLLILFLGSRLWHYASECVEGMERLRAYRASALVCLEAMQQSLNETQAELAAAQSRCEAQQRDLEAAHSRQQEAEARVATLQGEHTALQQQCIGLERNLEAARFQRQAAEARATTLLKDQEAIRNNVSELQDKLTLAQTGQQDAEMRVVMLQAECDSLREELSQIKSGQRSMVKQVRDALDKCESLQHKCDVLQDALTSTQSSQQEAETQVTTLKGELNALKTQYAKQVRLGKLWHTKATQLEQQNKQLQDLKARHQALEDNLKQERQQSELYRRICVGLIDTLRRADPNLPEVKNLQEIDAYLSKRDERWWKLWK